jgi:hypothetical protein
MAHLSTPRTPRTPRSPRCHACPSPGARAAVRPCALPALPVRPGTCPRYPCPSSARASHHKGAAASSRRTDPPHGRPCGRRYLLASVATSPGRRPVASRVVRPSPSLALVVARCLVSLPTEPPSPASEQPRRRPLRATGAPLAGSPSTPSNPSNRSLGHP